MSIGLCMRGSSDVAGWIEQVAERMAALAHPAAEPIEVTADGDVMATTTPAGPGYHVAVCEALDAAAPDLGITWSAPPGDDEEDGGDGGDETGYFRDRDLAALQGHMLAWLQGVARSLLRGRGGDEVGVDGIAIGMGIDHRYQVPGIATPMGPRDAAWLRAVAEGSAGVDFFPWWTPGEDAAALLGRARCLMWTEVRWCEAVSDEHAAVQREVVSLLRRAWEEDASIEVPAREWCELDPEAPAEVVARARRATGPLIGYRRRPVRVGVVAGWSVEIPGEMAEGWKEHTWSAWDGGRTVWFDAVRADRSAAELVAEVPGEGAVVAYRDGAVIKRGRFERTEDGLVLHTRNAVDGALAVMTIVGDEADREWAIATWRSLRRGAP